MASFDHILNVILEVCICIANLKKKKKVKPESHRAAAENTSIENRKCYNSTDREGTLPQIKLHCESLAYQFVSTEYLIMIKIAY